MDLEILTSYKLPGYILELLLWHLYFAHENIPRPEYMTVSTHIATVYIPLHFLSKYTNNSIHSGV